MKFTIIFASAVLLAGCDKLSQIDNTLWSNKKPKVTEVSKCPKTDVWLRIPEHGYNGMVKTEELSQADYDSIKMVAECNPWIKQQLVGPIKDGKLTNGEVMPIVQAQAKRWDQIAERNRRNSANGLQQLILSPKKP